MLYILEISLVTYIFKLDSLKSATKAINLASFKEIQWQIILIWNVGLYLKFEFHLSYAKYVLRLRKVFTA